MWAFNKTDGAVQVYVCTRVHTCLCIHVYEILYREISAITACGVPACSPAILIGRPLGNEHFSAVFLPVRRPFIILGQAGQVGGRLCIHR